MNNYTKILTSLVFLSMLGTGCKHDDLTPIDKETIQMKSELQNRLSDVALIDSLKKFMANRINAGINDISYDSKNNQFLLFGTPQITYQELKAAYDNDNH